MKRIKFYIIPVFLIVLAFQSCYYDNEEYLYPQVFSSCDTLDVSYSGSISSILALQCLSCHSTATADTYGNSIILDNYAALKTYADNGRLLGAIKHETDYSPMPKNAGMLDNCKIKQFEIWINSGALNN